MSANFFLHDLFEKIIIFLLALIIIAFVIILFSGCSKSWCDAKYPNPPKDSIIERVKIDTFYIPMVADTSYIEAPADCPDQRIIYKDGKIEYKIIIKDKILTVYRFTRADSIRAIFAFKNTEEYKEYSKTNIVTQIKEKTPKWAWYLLGVNIVFVLIFIVYLYFRFRF